MDYRVLGVGLYTDLNLLHFNSSPNNGNDCYATNRHRAIEKMEKMRLGGNFAGIIIYDLMLPTSKGAEDHDLKHGLAVLRSAKLKGLPVVVLEDDQEVIKRIRNAELNDEALVRGIIPKGEALRGRLPYSRLIIDRLLLNGM